MWDKSTVLVEWKIQQQLNRRKGNKKKSPAQKKTKTKTQLWWCLCFKKWKKNHSRQKLYFFNTSYFCQCDVEQVPLIKSAVIHWAQWCTWIVTVVSLFKASGTALKKKGRIYSYSLQLGLQKNFSTVNHMLNVVIAVIVLCTYTVTISKKLKVVNKQ